LAALTAEGATEGRRPAYKSPNQIQAPIDEAQTNAHILGVHARIIIRFVGTNWEYHRALFLKGERDYTRSQASL